MGAPIYTQEHRDQVLALTAQGLTNAQIAAKTGIKPGPSAACGPGRGSRPGGRPCLW